jgi:hypothetical protein
MNLLKNDLLMRKTGDRRRTELTEESASQCDLSAEFITPSRACKWLDTAGWDKPNWRPAAESEPRSRIERKTRSP